MKNIITRTITGLVFITVIVGGICFHPYLFMSVFGAITALTVWEFYGLAGNLMSKRITATAGGVYLFCASFLYASGYYADACIFTPYILFMMYIFISELYDRRECDHIHNLAFLVLGQVYCAVPFSLLCFIVFHSGVYAPEMALFLFIFVWINDTGAFLAGSTFGKRRLFERISPKKSWEGFAGGLLLTVASAFLAAKFVPELSLYVWLVLSVFIVVFATFGDLVESLLKRSIGIKDTGNLLPGHGGLLDRFDSILMAIPALYIFLRLIV